MDIKTPAGGAPTNISLPDTNTSDSSEAQSFPQKLRGCNDQIWIRYGSNDAETHRELINQTCFTLMAPEVDEKGRV